MKQIILLAFVFLSSISAKANDAFTSSESKASVEKTIFGFQTGFFGIWANNETRLANQFALRSEIGFNMAYVGGGFFGGNGLVLIPTISVEPRWYYNLNKRVEKQRPIYKNSANFVSIQTTYIPDWFVVSKLEVGVPHQITIIPTWGIKRTALKHLTYEIGGGIGYGYSFIENASLRFKSDVAINILLRIGYTF